MNAWTQTAAILNSLDTAGVGLRVEFRRLRDRYGHRIVAVNQAQQLEQPLLTSVEGAGQDLWPPSPALQGLNIDGLTSEESAGPAMLIGMAGNTHWSLSIESAPTSGQNGQRLLFDVACRLRSKQLPAVLRTKYHVADSVMCDDRGNQVYLLVSNIKYVVQLHNSHESDPLTMPCELSLDDRYLQTTRPIQFSDTVPLTARWRYTIQRCR